MAIRLFTIFTLIILNYSGINCYSQQYKFNHFGVNEGLSQTFIYTINQDDKGFLWIGTSDGLFHFDGFEFTHFTTEDSLAGNFITESMNAKNGHLWFGHMNGGITYYDGHHFTRFATVENPNAITGISEGENGNIWISTQTEGFFRIDRQKKIHHIATPFQEEYILNFVSLEDNHLMTGTDQSLYMFEYIKNKNRLVQKARIEGIPKGKITHIIQSETNKTLYAICEAQGIYLLKWKEKTHHYTARKIDFLNEEELENIQEGLIDREGNVWVNSMGSGVFKMYPKESQRKTLHLSKENGLPSNDVKCLFEDREGNIWFGLYGMGLARFVEDKLIFYSFRQQLNKNSFYALDGTKDQLWAGSDKKVVRIDRHSGEILDILDESDGLPDEKITALFKHPNGNIWIGSEESGVYILNTRNNHISKIPISDNELENSINYITGDQNNIWIATKKGVCHIDQKSNKKTWYNTEKGLPHNNIQHLYIDSAKKVLVGTQSNKLVSIDQGGSVKEIPILEAEGLMLINSITKDKPGNIWICTYGNGVFKIGKDVTRQYDRDSGLLSNYGYSLVYSNDKILVGHHGGISEIHIKTNTIKTYARNYGMKSSTELFTNAAFAGSGNKVCFGTSEGILLFSSKETSKDKIPPKLNITNIAVNNEDTERRQDHITLKPGSYELEFEFIGIQLRDPESVKYQYKLKGYSKDWSEPISKQTVRFGNVRPGEYTFQLRAFNENNLSTQTPLSLDIHIKKHIYQSVWFYVILVILVLLLGYSIIIIRERNLVHEKKILEKKVRHRTEELYKANEELALRNEDITSSIEYAKRIQMAILPAKVPFGHTLIFYRPKDIVSGDFYWLASHKGIQYMAAVDCTGHGVPGAFMSFIGHTALKKIIIEHNTSNPSEILYHLNEEVASTLNQKEEDLIKDGMDIGLTSFDPDNRQLIYAGGFIPLWLIRNNELIEYKGNRLSIGHTKGDNIRFTNHNIKLEKGDSIYLLSDGFSSQFGGEYGKKFKTKTLKELILSIQNETISEQKRILEKTLEEWMRDYEQIDDIMIIGRTII